MQVQGSASPPRISRHGTIAGLAFAVLLASAWEPASAATVGAASLLHAAAQSAAAVRRARPAHPLDLSEPRGASVFARASGLRLEGSRALVGALTADKTRGSNDSAGGKAGGPITVHWQSSPEIVRVARQFRHNGLPILRLWQSGQNLVAIGLNPRGVPGIYFTQQVKD